MVNRLDRFLGAGSLPSVNEEPVDPQFSLVVVSNRLPVAWKNDATGQQHAVLSPGGLVTALSPALAGKDVAWVGWSGDEHASEEPMVFEGMTLIPVSVDASVMEGHYEGLSNRTLWPLFHDVGVSAEFDEGWWSAYREVNLLFAHRVAEIVSPGGVVWVHDYQLMLACQMIRELRPDVRIGYFHHIPFPPVHLFEGSPPGEDLVSGVLGADVVGFQRTSDVKHFVDAATQWGLATETSPTALAVGDRAVAVGAFPISIDFRTVSDAAASDTVVQKARDFRESWGDPTTVFLGVDRIDYTKGIPERLEAYQALLETSQLSAKDVVFVQAGSPSRENVGAYQDLATRLSSLVDDINRRHSPVTGTQAVHYLAENLPREDMLALFVAADVMVVNALRDGMNLVAKEFVACRNDDSGVLVLSTTTGASDHMAEALLVDPTDASQLQDALLRATQMDAAEMQQRMRGLRAHLATHDVARWSRDFLTTLEASPGPGSPDQ